MAKDQQFQHWDFKNLVRFEAYRILDSQIDPLELETRDRNIFNQSGTVGSERRSFFRFWLNDRQTTEPLEPDVGTLVLRVFKLLGWLAVFVGLLTGIGASLTALHYDGIVPVNVAVYLGFLLVPQIVLLLTHLVVLVLASIRRDILKTIYAVPKVMVAAIGQYSWKQYMRLRKSDAQTRDHFFHLGTLFSQFVAQHGKLVAVNAYALTQQFAVFFNLGIVGAALVLLAFSDRAFGWQSSLTDSPEVVLRLLKAVAVPWTWLLSEGVAYPDLEAIQGSYIVLGKPIEGLEQNHLTAWWPFLVAGIICYGLIPRILGWLISFVWFKRSLKQMDFHSVIYNSLWARAHSFDLESKGMDTTVRDDREGALSDVEEDIPASHNVVVVSEEIEKRYGLEILKRWVQEHCGLSKFETISFSSSCLSVDLNLKGATPLLLVEGWQPPIQEKLDSIKSFVGSELDKSSDWYLVLIGKPGKGIIRELPPEMQNVWKTKIGSLGLVHLHLLHTDRIKDNDVN